MENNRNRLIKECFQSLKQILSKNNIQKLNHPKQIKIENKSLRTKTKKKKSHEVKPHSELHKSLIL